MFEQLLPGLLAYFALISARMAHGTRFCISDVPAEMSRRRREAESQEGGGSSSNNSQNDDSDVDETYQPDLTHPASKKQFLKQIMNLLKQRMTKDVFVTELLH